jgi:uncharacterized protein (DUF1697 family)
MPKYVAFLRAINVGGHSVKMDYLRRLFETLGFSNVETFIASGNVIFDSTSKSTKTLKKKIESLLQEALGYEVATFIRSTAELATIADHKPFPDMELRAESNVLYIGFLADEPSEEAKQKVQLLKTEVDDFDVRGRELYWLCGKNISGSAVSVALLAKTLGVEVTLRSSTTVKHSQKDCSKILMSKGVLSRPPPNNRMQRRPLSRFFMNRSWYLNVYGATRPR